MPGYSAMSPSSSSDAEQLVVLGHAIRAARRAGLDLAGVEGHGDVGDGRVFGLAGAVRNDGGVTARLAIWMASSVSVREPIWLTLMRIALPTCFSMPVADARRW